MQLHTLCNVVASVHLGSHSPPSSLTFKVILVLCVFQYICMTVSLVLHTTCTSEIIHYKGLGQCLTSITFWQCLPASAGAKLNAKA